MNSLLLAWKVSRWTPIPVVHGALAAGGWFSWATKAKEVRRLEDNLHRITGLEGRELRRLSRKGMASAMRYYAETLIVGKLTRQQVDARVRCDIPQNIAKALDEDGKVVVVLSHSGNWDLVGGYTSHNIGKIISVAEVLKPVEVFEAFVKLREDLGMTILGHEGSTTFRKLLQLGNTQGGIIALLADRDLSGDGVLVDWAGHKARVAPGPAAAALALKCRLAPLEVYYERLRGARRRAARSRWGVVMEFGPFVEVPSEGDNRAKVEAMSREWAAWLSGRVQEHPEDWHMLQRFGWVED